jgi:hypothetical protein
VALGQKKDPGAEGEVLWFVGGTPDEAEKSTLILNGMERQQISCLCSKSFPTSRSRELTLSRSVPIPCRTHVGAEVGWILGKSNLALAGLPRQSEDISLLNERGCVAENTD